MASLLAGAGISAIGSLIGSGKQASAIKDAANTQAQAADYSANLQSQAEGNSLNYTKGVYSDTTAAAQPYEQAGATALSQLSAGTAAGGEFNSSPTSDQVMAQDPGYQFNLDEGQQALERAQAAGGNVGSGGAMKEAAQYVQGYASNAYNDAYNRFMTTRQSNYTDLANLATAGLGGVGVQANAGTGAASNVSNTSLTGAANQGSYLTQGANATAAGGVGVANAGASAISSIGTNLQQVLAANPGLLNQSGYGPAATNYYGNSDSDSTFE